MFCPLISRLKGGKPQPGRLQQMLYNINTFRASRSLLILMRKARPHLGLYSTHKLEEFVDAKLRASPTFAALSSGAAVTFGALHCANEPARRLLKILATDLGGQQPRILGFDTAPDSNIARAVAASSAYPFVFQPVALDTGLATDAGVSANLPLHLFETERLEYRWPLIAFDFESEVQPLPATPRFPEFAYRLLNTALEASEQPLKEVLKSVVHVRIKIPKKFTTFDFGLTKQEKDGLFKLGKEQTEEQFEAQGVGDWRAAKTQRELLRLFYGAAEDVEAVLRTIAGEFTRVTPACDVRCHVMLPTSDDRRIVVYQHGMRECTDYDIAPRLEEGVTGAAWRTRTFRLDDIETMREEKGDCTRDGVVIPHEFIEAIPKERRAMLAVPILNPEDANARPLGTLAVDSTMTPDETKWGGIEGFKWDSGEATAASRLVLWAKIVGSILT